MASVNIIPATPRRALTSKARRVRADERSIETDPSVDVCAEARKLPETYAATVERDSTNSEADTHETLRPDVRPLIGHPDGASDMTGSLEQEEPDQADVSLQANEAYQALRQSDEEPTTVGTI